MTTLDLMREVIGRGARLSLDAAFPVVLSHERVLPEDLVVELEGRVREIAEILHRERRRRVLAGDIAALAAVAIVREHAGATA